MIQRPMDDTPNTPTREDVVSAYRLLLGREPEDEHVIAEHLKVSDRTALLRRFVQSAEYRSRVRSVRPPLPTLDGGIVTGPLSDFAPVSWPEPVPEYWVDALGVRTRCAFRTDFSDRSGQVFQRPDDAPLEWQALLEALAAARDRFCMIELGAGYGPWLARAGVAWRRRYPGRELVLVGAEAEPEHFTYLNQHFADNDIPAACLRLLPVLRAAGSVLRDQVRRLVVGTHGRDVEGQLINRLIPLGFQLQAEDACHYRLDGARPVLVADGTQVWINRVLVTD
jgi:hypothetical protein